MRVNWSMRTLRKSGPGFRAVSNNPAGHRSMLSGLLSYRRNRVSMTCEHHFAIDLLIPMSHWNLRKWWPLWALGCRFCWCNHRRQWLVRGPWTYGPCCNQRQRDPGRAGCSRPSGRVGKIPSARTQILHPKKIKMWIQFLQKYFEIFIPRRSWTMRWSSRSLICVAMPMKKRSMSKGSFFPSIVIGFSTTSCFGFNSIKSGHVVLQWAQKLFERALFPHLIYL